MTRCGWEAARRALVLCLRVGEEQETAGEGADLFGSAGDRSQCNNYLVVTAQLIRFGVGFLRASWNWNFWQKQEPSIVTPKGQAHNQTVVLDGMASTGEAEVASSTTQEDFTSGCLSSAGVSAENVPPDVSRRG